MSNTIDICNELHQNFVDFAYEANSERAFPDARDGLKPGQRACLWEMYTKGYSSSKPHVKSAKISGGTIATWWPHGDVAIYDTFARMSQPWINNIPEVDWHGNNGNIVIGSIPASSRYTEARLSKVVEEGMLQGLKKNNVPMIKNFSEDEEWPEVFPAVLPRLLVNGSQGIGVTIANVWIPMNFSEVAETIVKYIKTGELDYSKGLIDFPSGGEIINGKDLHIIHETGKGRVTLRGKAEIKKDSILITELPYQVYVEPFIDSIKELLKEDENSLAIKNIYNKTDKKQLLIEIVCDGDPYKVLRTLYAKTDLQKAYNANQWALIGKTPQLLTLKDYIDVYIKHNLSCIVKEHKFDLEKAKNRLEIVDGLIKALANIDAIIELIKSSESASKAKDALMAKYQFTENQAKAILDMKLARLAKLEKIELENEKAELEDTIQQLTLIINDVNLQDNILIERLENLVKKYGNKRRTTISQIEIPKGEEEIAFVEPEKCVVVLTESGLVKRMPTSSFRTQKRNGKGVKSQDDITSMVIRTDTVDQLMVFTDQGRMYRLLVNDIPVGTNTTKGQPIKSLITMENNENPTVIYSIYRGTDEKYVLFATKNGLVKKTTLEEYLKTKKKSGIAAISIKEGDSLASVSLVKDEDIILLTKNGMAIKFNSAEVSCTSRTTSGIKGITLNKEDEVIGMLPIRNKEDQFAIFSQKGLAKKIKLEDLPIQKRAGKGLSVYKVGPTTGDVVCGALISDEDNILIAGMVNNICISATEIPLMNRGTIGNQVLKGIIKSVSKI